VPHKPTAAIQTLKDNTLTEKDATALTAKKAKDERENQTSLHVCA
jgi:hypothetical protein